MFKINDLQIELNNSILANTWMALHEDLNIPHDEVLNDSQIDKEQFRQSILEANDLFGFNWPLYPNTQQEFNKMHKDIETAPKDKADVIQSVHNQLHVMESGGGVSQIQFAWNKSLGQFFKRKPVFKEMPKNAEPFAKQISLGDVFLGYPHVGKSPESCMLHNDNENLLQTCRLHDRISPDIVIRIAEGTQYCDTDKKLEKWYDDNKINIFSKQDMLKYNGWPVIGTVVNKKALAV